MHGYVQKMSDGFSSINNEVHQMKAEIVMSQQVRVNLMSELSQARAEARAASNTLVESPDCKRKCDEMKLAMDQMNILRCRTFPTDQ